MCEIVSKYNATLCYSKIVIKMYITKEAKIKHYIDVSLDSLYLNEDVQDFVEILKYCQLCYEHKFIVDCEECGGL